MQLLVHKYSQSLTVEILINLVPFSADYFLFQFQQELVQVYHRKKAIDQQN